VNLPRALPPAAGPLLLLLALVAGLALDALPGTTRINLFAPPLLAMLAWNLAVYAGLLVVALRPGAGLREPRRAALAAWLHGAAALLAAGAVLSMYARGSFFEFRAGWDSTFFEAPALHRFMSALFGPAAWLGGITLPTVDEFAALRFSSAGGGERAARWIHLYAITIGVGVVLPRVLLAAWSARRAAAVPAPPAAPELAARRVLVLPYSYRIGDELRSGLQRVLAQRLQARVDVELIENVVQGDEAEVRTRLGAGGAAPVLLFALSATPEAETHGALLRALAAAPALVLVDESGFRRRFSGADGQARLAERRALWRRWLAERGHEAVFADLLQPETGP
jgi:ribosomal protein L34